MKYILVTGGVLSGLGKGVIASSIGTLLKAFSLRVTSIKIDPYINIDAGTFSPYEHGEVFVLEDGGEVDLDLGNYERFLDITLHKDNNITTGKIYQQVIEKERRGDYLGKTVQIVPHITNAIQDWVQRVALIPVDKDKSTPQVCVIELGGTIGDIEGMPFVEAFRQFGRRVGRENFCCIHVSLVPHQKATGEDKTKPTLRSIETLRGRGLLPDMIVCRSDNPLSKKVREKVSEYCDLEPKEVLYVHNMSSIYRVPLALEEQGLIPFLANRLSLELPLVSPKRFLWKWRDLADRYDNLTKEVNIALVGKYTKLIDSYASVIKALRHSSLAINYKLNLTYIESECLELQFKSKDAIQYYESWQLLCKTDGIVVPGGFGDRGIEGKILAIEWARINKKPFLGICLGLQCAVIEFARNVLKWEDPNSTEIDPNCKTPVVIDMPEHNPGNLGGTMRVGKRTTIFRSDFQSTIRQLYKNVESVDERHRHRYEVNPEFVAEFNEKGMKFVGHDTEEKRMEIMELSDHPYFVGVQYHPEYLSRPLAPSPPFMGLLLASCDKLESYLRKGCSLTPQNGSEVSSSSGDEDFSLVKFNKNNNKKD